MNKQSLFDFCQRPFLKKIFSIFEKNNTDIKLVGGIVRDYLLGLLHESKSYDIDLAINLPVDDVLKIFEANNFHCNAMAKSYGTLTVYDHESQFFVEITSLRKDFNQQGRASNTYYTNSWEEDAKRRDFTINAIYFHPVKGFYDPFNGMQDIKDQKISFIGDAQKRIQEDYLRSIRFFRFLAYFKQPIFDESLYRILKKYFHKLPILSKERITQELFKIANAKYPQNSLYEMCRTDLWDALGVKNVPDERFLFPENFKPSFTLILSLLDDDNFLKKALALPKKILRESLLFKRYKSIEEAYYEKGKIWCIDYAWYQSCIHGYDFEALKNQIEMLSQKHPLPIFPINGTDIMECLNISGKQVGEVLEKTKIWWIEHHFSGGKSECLLYAESLLK